MECWTDFILHATKQDYYSKPTRYVEVVKGQKPGCKVVFEDHLFEDLRKEWFRSMVL